MLVKALLESKPRRLITASPSTSIDEAMDQLISNSISCLPILEDEKLTGIITDQDIFKKIHQTKGEYHSLRVQDVMTVDLIVGLLDDEISYIVGLMGKNWIRHVPIVEGEKLVGLVSQRDIVKQQAENTEVENRYLKMYTEGMHRRDKSGDL
jgi:CBS domain-containing protein